LVGTIIIAAVAIIFLPDLLDGANKNYQEEFKRIPQAPSIDFSPKNQTFPEDKLSQLPKDNISDEVALDDSSKTQTNKVSITDDKTVIASSNTTKVNIVKKDVAFDKKVVTLTPSENKKLPERAIAKQAWVIQLGSFRHKNNVDELVSKLKSSGYTVFTKPIKTKNGNLTKVFVGPELIKPSLEKKLPALKKLTNVQGKVARFNPVNR